jgi:hypothetical protein
MKPPLPRTLSAVPQTLHVQLEIAKAIRTLAGPDEDELLRRRRAEIAAIRRDFELLAADIRKAFEEAGALAKAELRAALKKYSPDQPRVPAGNPDGGEWTSGSKSPSGPSGVARDGSATPKRYAALITDVITDASSGPRPDPRYAAAAEEGAEEDESESESRANRDRLRRPTREQQQRLDDANARLQAAISQVRTIDANWRPTPGFYNRGSIENDILEIESEIREAQARYWQLTEARGSRPGSSGYPIDLLEEDARVYGSHIFERHVGKSPDYLFRRLSNEDISAAGSFTSVEAANKLINATVADDFNSKLVDAVVRGDIANVTLYKNFNSPTGYEAVRSETELQDTYGVYVFIARNPYLARGFRVMTAYPGNRKSR